MKQAIFARQQQQKKVRIESARSSYSTIQTNHQLNSDRSTREFQRNYHGRSRRNSASRAEFLVSISMKNKEKIKK